MKDEINELADGLQNPLVLENEIENIQEKADDILENGDPIEYILEVHQSMHVGDINLAKTLLISIGVQSVKNSEGIQPKVSGDSGKGKTHCCKAMAHLIPSEWIEETTLSNKVIFYMGIKPSTIIFSDDVNLSEDLEGAIKRATTNFQTDTIYKTLDTARKPKELKIPPRICWWLTSVDDNQGLQLLNRQFGGSVNESKEQDKKVAKYELEKAFSGTIGYPENDDVKVCREIIRNIKKQLFTVKIPYSEKIEWTDDRNRRNLSIFLDLIRGFAVLNYKQRETDEEGALVADITDFYNAKELYESRSREQGLKITDTESRLLDILSKRKEATRNELALEMGVSVGRISQLMNGKKYTDSGLLYKISGLSIEKRSERNDNGYAQLNYYKLENYTSNEYNEVVSLIE